MVPDRIKEELSWLRVVFPLVVGIDASLAVYLVQGVTTRVVWTLTAIALSLGVGLLVYVIVTVYALLHALEEKRHDLP